MGQFNVDKRKFISTLEKRLWQILIQPNSGAFLQMQEVLKEFHSGTQGAHPEAKKTLERLKQLLGHMPSNSEGLDNKLYPVYCRQRSHKSRSRTAAAVQFGRILEEYSDGQ